MSFVNKSEFFSFDTDNLKNEQKLSLQGGVVFSFYVKEIKNCSIQFILKPQTITGTSYEFTFKAELFTKTPDREKVASFKKRRYVVNQNEDEKQSCDANQDKKYKDIPIVMRFVKNAGSQNFTINITITHDAEIHNPTAVFSKNVTGLKNPMCLCYMNTVIQQLYNIPVFRKLIFQIPNTSPNLLTTTIPFHLQKLFYAMQYSCNTAQRLIIDTSELRTAFGWNSKAEETQQDAHEFLVKLLDKLSYKFIPYPELNQKFKELFDISFEECDKNQEKDIITTRSLDLPSVKGCTTLKKELTSFFSTRKLVTLPDIINIHINRDDHAACFFQYPGVFDMGQFIGDHHRIDYDLVSVAVHITKAEFRHYQVYVSPSRGKWYLISDSSFQEAESTAMFESVYGRISLNSITALRSRSAPIPKHQPIQVRGQATMLMYVRSDKFDEIMSELPESEVPQQIKDAVQTKQPKVNLYENKIIYYTEKNLKDLFGKGKKQLEYDDFNFIDVDPNDDSKDNIIKYIGKAENVDPSEITLWSTKRDTHTPNHIFNQDKKLQSYTLNERTLFVTKKNTDTATFGYSCHLFVRFRSKDRSMEFIGLKEIMSIAKCSGFVPFLKEKLGTEEFNLYYFDNNRQTWLKIDLKSEIGNKIDSFIVVQTKEDEEINREDLSLVSGQSVSYFQLIGEKEMTSLTNINMIENASDIIAISDFSMNKIKLRIPTKSTVRDLEQLYRDAFKIQMTDKTKIKLFKSDRNTKAPILPNLETSVAIGSLQKNSLIYATAFEQDNVDNIPYIVGYSASKVDADFFMLLSMGRGKTINDAKDLLRSVVPSIPDNLLPVSISSKCKSVIKKMEESLGTGPYVIRFYELPPNFAPNIKAVTCMKACYMIPGHVACPISQHFLTFISSDDTEEAIREKVISKLDNPDDKFNIVLARYVDLSVDHEKPLTDILTDNAYILLVIYPDVEFNDVPFINETNTKSDFTIFN